MGFAEGVVWSLLGAVAHTAIDVLRKFGAQRLPPADLIALLTLYNAAFAVMGAWLIDGALPRLEDIPNPHLFIKAVFATAAMSLTAAVLYQRALSIAPLSLTVPYLAFAPVFVVFVSPLFLVGEVPSALGLMGVAVVSVAGYKLGVLGAADAAALSQQATKPPKAHAPLLPVGSKGTVVGNGMASSKMLFDDSLRQEGQLIPAADVRGRAGEGALYVSQQPQLQPQQQQQQHSRVFQRQPAQLPLKASSHELHLSASSEQGGHNQQLPAGQQQQQSLEQAEEQHLLQDEQQQQPQGLSSGGSDVRGSGGGMKQKSAWAIAYYKQKSPPVGVWEAARGGLQSAAQQLLATTTSRSPRSRGGGVAHSSYFAAGSPNGYPASSSTHQNGHLLGSSDGSSNGSSAVWVDSQAKASKEAKHQDAKRAAHAAFLGAQRSSNSSARARRLPPWLRVPLRRLQQLVRGPVRLLSGPTAGPSLVLITAFLYSVTASMDKLGMSSSSSTAFYLVVQRLLIASVSLLYLLLCSPHTLRHLYTDAALLFSMSLVEQAAIVLYFKAIQNMLVSYMVAIKRINVLLSTLVGCVMFKERIGRRMPYILLMLLGMLLIVLQPGHEALHHSHHTRH